MAYPTVNDMSGSNYEKMNIQWFPGHMTKAQRMIEDSIKQVDAVCEILDARIPNSSRNPDIDRLASGKPRLIILNRTDLADPKITAQWRAFFEAQGIKILETDAKSGKGVNGFAPALRELLKDKIADYAAKGQVNRPMRVMILGIPNVGKSTFINKVAKRKAAVAGDKPGVTRGKQWINIDKGLDLLDTPGILWPKFDDQQVAIKLGYTGAIKDDVMDVCELADSLLGFLWENYKGNVITRYKLDENTERPDIEMIARKRGMLISGGEPDIERAAAAVLDEFRSGKLGRISLERP